MANRNWLSQKLYQMEAYPVMVSCTFTVDSTAPAGVTNLTGGTVQAVYMNSSAPSGGTPWPADGVIQVRLQDNYSKLLGLTASIQEPTDGTGVQVVAVQEPYVITLLGNTTLAEWQAVGLPEGVVPAVGVCFIASTNGTIQGTGEVQPLLPCDAPEISILGNANANLQRLNSAVNGGAILTLASRAAGVRTKLVDGTVVRLNMYLSNSSVQVQGQ